MVKDNLAVIGCNDDVRVIDYLGDAAEILEKSTAFVRMLAYFSRRARKEPAA